MKCWLYYITRDNFNEIFSLDISLDNIHIDSPLFHNLLFNDDNIALYAFTFNKRVAKQFESERDMSKFVKLKDDVVAIPDNLSTKELFSTELIGQLDDEIKKFDLILTDEESMILRDDLLSYINDYIVECELDILDEEYDVLRKNYKEALETLGFTTFGMHEIITKTGDLDRMPIYHLNHIKAFIKIYRKMMSL